MRLSVLFSISISIPFRDTMSVHWQKNHLAWTLSSSTNSQKLERTNTFLSNVGTTLNGVHEKWNGSSKINIIKTTKWASFSSSMNISLLANTMPQCRLYNTNIKMLATLLNNNLSSAEKMRWERKNSDIEKIWIQIQPLHNSMTWIHKLQYVNIYKSEFSAFFSFVCDFPQS